MGKQQDVAQKIILDGTSINFLMGSQGHTLRLVGQKRRSSCGGHVDEAGEPHVDGTSLPHALELTDNMWTYEGFASRSGERLRFHIGHETDMSEFDEFEYLVTS